MSDQCTNLLSTAITKSHSTRPGDPAVIVHTTKLLHASPAISMCSLQPGSSHATDVKHLLFGETKTNHSCVSKNYTQLRSPNQVNLTTPSRW